MSAAAAPARRADAGFALVETLIAAAILCTRLAAYLQSAASGAATERMIADRREATLIARSALEAAGTVGADAQLTQGGANDRYRWTVSVAPYGDATGGPGLQVARVVVLDRATGRPLVRLATLRLSR